MVERNPVNGNHWDRLAEARFGAGTTRAPWRPTSAAQNTDTFIERHTNAIFVGEPTAHGPTL